MSFESAYWASNAQSYKLDAELNPLNKDHLTMYRAFNLRSLSFNGSANDLAMLGRKMNEENARKANSALARFVNDDGSIDGAKVMRHWFPTIQAEVFISHSHKDEKLALQLAGWLNQELQLRCFVDSCVWGHSHKLLREVDETHCWSKNGETFDYQKRNGSTAHIHMMLSTALAMMIDSTECVIFLNTANSNSISPTKSIAAPHSPWLFYELSLMRMIRRRSPEEHRSGVLMENFSTEMANNALPFVYPTDVNSLTHLDADNLNDWNSLWARNVYLGEDADALDILYNLVPESHIS